MKTPITELLNIDYPVICGAMANVSDPDLVAAVSNAGGLGVLATGTFTVDEIKSRVEDILTKTEKPFAVNVYLLSPHADQVVDYLCQSEVKIITTGAGNPGKYMDDLKEAGIIVMPVVASVAHAKRMQRVGAHAVIVEGMEAGGHIGQSTTMTLLPQITEAVDIPVVAAGGIADGRGMAESFMLGATGIQMGTRFIVAKESNAHPNFKKKVVKANDIATEITGNITGHPIRLLRNPLTREYLKIEKSITSAEEPDLSVLEDLTKGSLGRAVFDGDIKTGSMMAGQSAGLVKEEQTASEIIEEVCAEAKDVYANQAKYLG